MIIRLSKLPDPTKGGNMPAYLIAKVWVEDKDGYELYRQMVAPTIERFGGRFLARGGRIEVLEGGPCSDRVIIVEFPNYETALEWYSSAEYAPAKTQRMSASEAELTIVDGL
jgi:uncharacterized protein (DUF1330 family)